MNRTRAAAPIVTAFFAAAVAGCAVPFTYRVSDDDAPARTAFTLVDRRDEVQKKQETMSYLMTNCGYGVWRIGDDQIVPDRLTVLARELQKRAGARLQGRTVSVRRFEIYNNMLGATMTLHPFRGCEYAYPDDPAYRGTPAIVTHIEIDVDGVILGGKFSQFEPYGDDRISGPVVSERIRRGVRHAAGRIADMVANPR